MGMWLSVMCSMQPVLNVSGPPSRSLVSRRVQPVAAEDQDGKWRPPLAGGFFFLNSRFLMLLARLVLSCDPSMGLHRITQRLRNALRLTARDERNADLRRD
jgi:hypothetical protein